MSLNSPGVEVTVIDQSQYLSAPPASVPLLIIATAQNKLNASGTATAPGTTKANANKLYAITSQRDWVSYFGNPIFYTATDGTPLQGYELNEYGALAAYSVLGLTNLCYAVRADIDLAALKGRIGRPSAAPANGSYWLDITSSSFGIFEFNKATGVFTSKMPIVITDSMLVSNGGQPVQSVGNIGDYAMSLTTQHGSPASYSTYWFKNLQNTWVAVGSMDWQASWPTIQGTSTPVHVRSGNIVIAGKTVSVPNNPLNTVAGVAGAINAANIPFVSAQAVDGKLNVYVSNGSSIVVSGTTDAMADLGIVAGTYYAPQLSYGTNAQQPLWRVTDAQPRPTGSIWVKTNTPNRGTNIVINQYSAASAAYTTKVCPLAVGDWVINNALDATGGAAIPAGTIYAQYNFDSLSGRAPLQLFKRSATGESVFVGTQVAPTFANSATFEVWVSDAGSSALMGPYTVTLPASGTLQAADFTTAWTSAGIPNTTCAVSATGALVLTHTLGGVIILDDKGIVVPASAITAAGFTINTSPSIADGAVGAKWGPFKTVTHSALATTGGNGSDLTVDVSTTGYTPTFSIATPGTNYAAGDIVTVTGGGALGAAYQVLVTSIGIGGTVAGITWFANEATPQFMVQLSNWQIFDYVANDIAPVMPPVNGTLWYYSDPSQVDIMTNVAGVWKGYRNVCYGSNGLPVATGTPATDPAGPIISASMPTQQSDATALVYGDLWVDTSDLSKSPQLHRWQSYNGQDQWVLINNADHTTENGVLFADARWGTSGMVDPIDDAIPTIASLLVSDYLDLDAPMADLYPQGTLLWNSRRGGYNVKHYVTNYFNLTDFPDSVLPEFTSTWVTVSGSMPSGEPYMGAAAQRQMVVKALKTTIDTVTTLRDEDTFFNLIACPNYPEVQRNLITLNNERGQTAYIIGDTPMTLKTDANDIINWATNANGASENSARGLINRDTYMGLYFPAGITNDLTGNQVVVPSSYMILSTMIYNDTVAYPWMAPAGQRRGVITNATNIGYLNAQSGEFIVDKNNVGLRDVEYTNFINPIANFTNLGLLNYGNKNSFNSSSALDRTNVARLINYLRVRLAQATRPFLFEPNDTITRTQVRAVCQSLLADIQSKRGVYDYLVVCDTTNNTQARIDRNELWIDIAIEPVKAVEFIYIPIRILNTGAIANLGTNG